MHKPNKQTVLPSSAVPLLMTSLPLSRLKGFGGKLGTALGEKFNTTTVSDLLALNEGALCAEFGDANTAWMLNAAHGVDLGKFSIISS